MQKIKGWIPTTSHSAKNFFFDALVKSGTIPNDGWANVKGFSDSFFIDKNNPRVEVEISEV